LNGTVLAEVAGAAMDVEEIAVVVEGAGTITAVAVGDEVAGTATEGIHLVGTIPTLGDLTDMIVSETKMALSVVGADTAIAMAISVAEARTEGTGLAMARMAGEMESLLGEDAILTRVEEAVEDIKPMVEQGL